MIPVKLSLYNPEGERIPGLFHTSQGYKLLPPNTGDGLRQSIYIQSEDEVTTMIFNDHWLPFLDDGSEQGILGRPDENFLLVITPTPRVA